MADSLTRRPWRYAVRAVLSIVTGIAIAWWLFFSWFIWTFRCGDNCSGGDAEHWRWAGQAVLAFPASVLALIALVLGFTRHQAAYRFTLATSICCALVWMAWVMGSGSF